MKSNKSLCKEDKKKKGKGGGKIGEGKKKEGKG